MSVYFGFLTRQCCVGLGFEENDDFYKILLPNILRQELALARRIQTRFAKTSDVNDIVFWISLIFNEISFKF